MPEIRHEPTDYCSGEPVRFCPECGVKVCSCEVAYGHDCEV